MQKKIAVFVEGQTELIFVEHLILEIAGYHKISIERQQLHGGRILQLYSTGSYHGHEKFHALIVDCSCDGKVKPAIVERKDALIKQGYTTIIGLRDLYPDFEKKYLKKLTKSLHIPESTAGVTIKIIVAVLEIEAWFLKEWSHLSKISPLLTVEHIRDQAGVDLSAENAEDLPHPAVLLDKIYSLVGSRYKKREKDAHRTATILDYAALYTTVRESTPSLDLLITQFDLFLE